MTYLTKNETLQNNCKIINALQVSDIAATFSGPSHERYQAKSLFFIAIFRRPFIHTSVDTYNRSMPIYVGAYTMWIGKCKNHLSFHFTSEWNRTIFLSHLLRRKWKCFDSLHSVTTYLPGTNVRGNWKDDAENFIPIFWVFSGGSGLEFSIPRRSILN